MKDSSFSSDRNHEKRKAFYQGLELIDDPRLNAAARLYIRLWGVPISGLRIRLRRILPELRGPYRRILDVGCGKGIFSFELAKMFPQAEILAIDVDQAQIDINNSIAQKHALKNLRFAAVDILQMDPEEAFDLVLTVDNLEHIVEDVKALRTIRALMKPGGAVLCHVPASERTWIFWGLKRNFDAPGHVRPGYNTSELREKLTASGLGVDWIKPSFGYLETVSNNLSYLITGAAQRNAPLYALAFPILNLLAWLGQFQSPSPDGAGVMAKATKRV